MTIDDKCACDWCVEHSEELTYNCKYSDKVFCKSCFECMMTMRERNTLILTLICSVVGYTVFNLLLV